MGCTMEFMSISETARKWGISNRRIQTLCVQGRIEGAARVGNFWVIPTDVEKPNDLRIKSGKYIGFSKRYHKGGSDAVHKDSEVIQK